MEIKELTSVEEMLPHLNLMRLMYKKMTPEMYKSFLETMVPNNYSQVAVFENGQCIGVTGMWFGTKLWCGKFIEIDNFIVHTEHRSKGIGRMICDFVDAKAKDLGCTNIVLDAYTTNFPAHRFYYNQGFGPKGFHFVKILDENGLT
jgi:GNAT superfamily N-acetyltransferase